MSYSQEEKQKYAKEKVKELTGKLEEGVKELFESGDFSKYLSFISMDAFRKYSWNNCMLILAQYPTASYVAGFKTWEKEFKRYPKKGEKAINILAPSKYKKKVKKKDENGKETDEEEEIEMFSYRSVPIFDVNQTEGELIPDFNTKLNEDIEDCDVLVDALIRVSSFPVNFQKGNKTGEINIDPTVHDQQLIKELTAEICKEELRKKQYPTVLSEGITYVICEHYGIDTSGQTFVNMAAWGKDKETKELKQAMKIIKEESMIMIEKLDKIIEE